MGRWQVAGVVLGCGLLVALAVFAGAPDDAPQPAATPSADTDSPEPTTSSGAPAPRLEYETVGVNPDLDVPEGFRGDVHPLLRGQGELELTALWSGVALRDPTGNVMQGTSAGTVDGSTPSPFRLSEATLRELRDPTIAVPTRTYDAEALSAFLPIEVERTGQRWTIDPARAGRFLDQFHAGVSTSFDRYDASYGRRAGPPGAFGVVRALSPTHVEIVFRLHAEFFLHPTLVYTPASFIGRMLIDRDARAVEYFEMRVPTEHTINVTLSVNGRHPETGAPVTTLLFERVARMALRGGNRPALEGVAWKDAMSLAEARDRLRRCFYKFLDIDWVPFDDVLEVAKAHDRPIFAVVLTSPLHDQAC